MKDKTEKTQDSSRVQISRPASHCDFARREGFGGSWRRDASMDGGGMCDAPTRVEMAGLGQNMSRREFTSLLLVGAGMSVTLGGLGGMVGWNSNQMRAGASEVVVTPEETGTFLIGPMAPSLGKNDDLYARALVLSDGKEEYAIITVDYIGFEIDFINVLAKAIERATGIGRDRIMINASHTHNAPLTIPWGPWETDRSAPLYQNLVPKFASVAARAKENLEPVTVCYHREPTQIGFNRRMPTGNGITMAPNPNGMVLPFVDILSFSDRGNQLVAALFSYAAHPVVVHRASRLISADYPGFAVETARAIHGDSSPVFMFAQGCGANINGFPLASGIKAAQATGATLGYAVARGLDKDGVQLTGLPLNSVSEEVELPLQEPSSPAKVKKMLSMAEDGSHEKVRLEQLLQLAEEGGEYVLRYPMRALAFGQDLCIVALPHETFAEYHRFAESISPFKNTMVLGYTNGVESYVATRSDYEMGERGGYEASPFGAALVYYHRLPLALSAEEMIHNRMQDMLNRLIK